MVTEESRKCVSLLVITFIRIIFLRLWPVLQGKIQVFQGEEANF